MNESVQLTRDDILSDLSLTGTAFTHAWSDRLDEWVADVAASVGIPPGAALVAVGGYGRREMAPESDLDIVLVHRPDADINDFAERVWYPMWDAGLKVGHRVDTVEGLLRLSRTDLDTATAILDARFLCGDEDLALELAVRATRQWKADGTTHATQLAERVNDLHGQFGEVAFLLGPDIKSGRGGIRDVQALRWVAATGALEIASPEALAAAYETLLRVRVALHRITGRPGDRLVLDYQDEVADQLGYGDADLLMADVSQAARSIAWLSDSTWFQVERSLEPHRRSTDAETIDDEIEIEGWLLRLADSADVAGSPEILLRVAVTAARNRSFIDHETLERLADELPPAPDPWTEPMRTGFAELLQSGRAAIPVCEALDQVGLMSWLIPEWEPCRSRPQRNAYHRFTVDRHLLEAAAEASALVDRVDRPDLLVLGALLHDIGKGYPGDHTDVGVDLIQTIGERMGYESSDVDLLVDMCRHHLLLPDAATRRDLDDDGTIRAVAATVGSLRLLDLLGALTEADSIATGPSAWNQSKSHLVSTLVDRAGHVLGGGEATEVITTRFPGPEQRAMMSQGTYACRIVDDTITVVQPDRPGAFYRVAGVIALNGLDIVSAAAHTETGVALSEFKVAAGSDIDVRRLEDQLERGVHGRLAIDARVDERRKTYARAQKRMSARPSPTAVRFDDDISEASTVIEVTGPDAIGFLYRISRAFAEIGVAIWSARIQTIGDAVIDSFYVTHNGRKISDADHQSEIERALLHAIGRK